MNNPRTVFLLGTLLAFGACQNTPDGTDMIVTVLPDLSSGAPADLSGPAGPQGVTIRDLNNYKVPDGAIIKFDGVVIGPYPYIELDTGTSTCNYNLFIVQADGAPTLQDGVEVVYSRKLSLTGDMALSVVLCQDEAKDEAFTKIPTGNAVKITGRLSALPTGAREVDLLLATDIVDQGKAQMQPVPVMQDPKSLRNVSNGGHASNFFAAQGALVQFQNVTVTKINAMYQDFDVSADGKNAATLAGNFLRVKDPAYTAPAVGTKLKSVTGIVLPDFGGAVWPRSVDDVLMQ